MAQVETRSTIDLGADHRILVDLGAQSHGLAERPASALPQLGQKTGVPLSEVAARNQDVDERLDCRLQRTDTLLRSF